MPKAEDNECVWFYNFSEAGSTYKCYTGNKSAKQQLLMEKPKLKNHNLSHGISHTVKCRGTLYMIMHPGQSKCANTTTHITVHTQEKWVTTQLATFHMVVADSHLSYTSLSWQAVWHNAHGCTAAFAIHTLLPPDDSSLSNFGKMLWCVVIWRSYFKTNAKEVLWEVASLEATSTPLLSSTWLCIQLKVTV